MSTVQLACPNCAGIFSLDSSVAGQQVQCPLCAVVVATPPLPDQPDGEAWPPHGVETLISTPAQTAAPLQVGCPLCAGVFQILPEMSGQQVQCPHCQQAVTLPELGPPAPASDPGWTSPSEPAPHSPVPTPVAEPPRTGSSGSFTPGPARHRTQDLLPPGMGAPAPKATEPAPAASSPPAKAPFQPASAEAKRTEEKPTESVAPAPARSFAYPPGMGPPNSPAASSTPVAAAPATAPKRPTLDDLLPPGLTPAKDRQAPAARPSQPPANRAAAPPEDRWERVIDPRLLPSATTSQAEKSKPPGPKSLLPPGAELPPGADASPDLPPGADQLLPPGVEQTPRGGQTGRGSKSADHLLPPGADDFLPPGADDSEAMPLRQVALPSQTEAVRQPGNKAADGSVLIPTEDGRQVALREPVKTVNTGGEERELRHRTPEERAARRFKKNLVLWTFSAILLVITVIILLRMGPL